MKVIRLAANKAEEKAEIFWYPFCYEQLSGRLSTDGLKSCCKDCEIVSGLLQSLNPVKAMLACNFYSTEHTEVCEELLVA